MTGRKTFSLVKMQWKWCMVGMHIILWTRWWNKASADWIRLADPVCDKVKSKIHTLIGSIPLLKIVFFDDVIVLIWFDLILKIQKRLRSLKFLVKNFTLHQRDLQLHIPKLYFPFSSKNRPPHTLPPPGRSDTSPLRSSSYETVNLKMSFLFRPLSSTAGKS